IRTIMDSPDVIKLICIGPLTNIKVALDQEPDIVKNAHFIGMQGSICRGYNGHEGITAEYNVVKDIPAAQKVLSANWRSITITPLDTCGLIRLQSRRYQAVKNCRNPITAAVIENYHKWNKPDKNFERESTVLFDTVAIYLALSEENLVMKEMKIKVGADGKIREDNSGRSMNVAIAWKNQNAFLDFLVARYTG
ncbi:MAG: nucleoside hydrolase, partial [Candidatus Aminicenantia bacterium]